MPEEKTKEPPDVSEAASAETPTRAEEVTVEETATRTPEATAVTRVERSRVAARPRRFNSTVVIAVALFAAAAAALLFWWMSRANGDGAGRVVTAPRTVTFDQPPAQGSASAPAPGEATLIVSP